MNRFFRVASVAFVGTMTPSAVQASAIVIWPVDPVIKPGEQTTTLWLENTGEAPVTLQVRTFGWSQESGKDDLTEQDRVVASPPIATVLPGHRQLVRLIRRPTGATVEPESSYRLIIDELPAAPGSPTTNGMTAQLAVQMRYSIPLFTYTADPATQKPQLVTSYRMGTNGREIEIRNAGTAHARLTDVRLVNGSKEQMAKAGLAGYVLPGATLRFPLPPGSLGMVKASVNGHDETLSPSA